MLTGWAIGLDASEEAQRQLLAAVKERVVAKGGLLTDEEFLELARGHAGV